MKNILKTISVLVSASLISVVAKAGPLEVTGSATATYVINGGQNSTGKALGISNELMFSASGELDNGFTWKYHTELDMADGGAASNDDTALVIGLGDLGTVGIYDAEGGLSTETGFGIGAVGVGQDFANTMTRIGMGSDVSAEAHVAYYTPAGLLPFGIEGAAGYAPNTADGQGNSAKNAGLQADTAAAGTTSQQYRLSAAPIDGLSIGASYFEFGGQSGEQKNDQNAESGAYYATYSAGPVSIGYSKAHKATHLIDNHDGVTATDAVEDYDQTNYSIAFAANDDLSVSYERETSEANKLDDTSVEQESSAVQVAYTMGGMTLAVSHASHDNNGYVDGANTDQTLFAVSMAF